MWVKEEGADKSSPWCLFSDPKGLRSHDVPADIPLPFLWHSHSLLSSPPFVTVNLIPCPHLSSPFSQESLFSSQRLLKHWGMKINLTRHPPLPVSVMRMLWSPWKLAAKLGLETESPDFLWCVELYLSPVLPENSGGWKSFGLPQRMTLPHVSLKRLCPLFLRAPIGLWMTSLFTCDKVNHRPFPLFHLNPLTQPDMDPPIPQSVSHQWLAELATVTPTPQQI